MSHTIRANPRWFLTSILSPYTEQHLSNWMCRRTQEAVYSEIPCNEYSQQTTKPTFPGIFLNTTQTIPPMLSLLWRSGGVCVVKWSGSNVGVSVATGRVSHARKVNGDDPDKKRYPGRPGPGSGLRHITSSRKKRFCQDNFLKDASDGT